MDVIPFYTLYVAVYFRASFRVEGQERTLKGLLCGFRVDSVRLQQKRLA